MKSLFSLLGWLAVTVSVHAKFSRPQEGPVDRLAQNAAAYVKTHREDANGYYILARVHYLAFSGKRDTIFSFPVKEIAGRPAPVERWTSGLEKPTGKDLKEEERLPHAVEALKAFREAIRLDPTTGLYELGLASLLEEIRIWQDSGMPADAPAELRKITFAEVRAAYTAAFELALEKDRKLTLLPLEGLKRIVSYEAADGVVRLENSAPLSPEDQQVLAKARSAMEAFKKLPLRGVTPVVVSFLPAASLTDLLEPANVVDFDLRGYGTQERWPWVRPDLGFLVWDPKGEGEIRSATQLFGGYTFQIFWRNGYHALASLDDNADGQLSGHELRGISIWFDRDSDGRSCKSEVSPVESLNVISISTRGESREGIHPTDPEGITLRDGRKLRTWDWIVEPVM